MGIFSKIMSMTKSGASNYVPDTEQEAWVSILYTIIAADGEVKDAEIDEICDTLQHKTFFDDMDVTDLYHVAAQAYKEHGGKTIIERCCEKISEENKNTVLALAVDLMLADGHQDDEELQLVEFLSDKLNVDRSVAKNVVDVFVWKNKYNKVRS